MKDEKLQYEINQEAVKISTLSPGKIDKYEYLPGEVLPYGRSRIIEQASFTYSPLGKAFSIWKTNENNWRSRNKPS